MPVVLVIGLPLFVIFSGWGILIFCKVEWVPDGDSDRAGN